MKRVIWCIVCIVAFYGVGTAAASPAVPQAATATSDHAIDQRIEGRLNASASLKSYHIKVSVEGGVVTLKGTVATDAQKARAGQLAMVTGVTSVDNQISVDPNVGTKGTAGKIEDKTVAGAKKVGEETKEGAKYVGEKTKEGAQKAGAEITDAYILTRVKGKFVGDDILKGSDINVDVDKHVVTLRGTVPTEAARKHAMALAKDVEGVKTVVDKLTIK